MPKRAPAQRIRNDVFRDSLPALFIESGAVSRFALSLAVFALVMSCALVSVAQNGADPWAGIEEMIVTGTEGSGLGLLSETGSVTQFGADDLAAYGIENTTDLADFTPNLEIVQNTATTATFFIRGIGLQDFSANAAGAIAIYLDGMPLNSPTLQVAPIFDASGVEVLKGPQGSGNFRNATGGIISIRSTKPDLSTPLFSVSTSQGQIVSVDAIDAYDRSYDGAFSIPIVPDVLATRFAFKTSDTDPFFTNRCGLRPDAPATTICGESNGRPPGTNRVLSGLDKEVGGRSVYSLRGSFLLAPPTDVDLQILGSAFFSRRDQGGAFGQAFGTGQGSTLVGGPTASDGQTLIDPVTGLPAPGRYQEPDQAAELRELVADGFTVPGAFPDRAPFDAFARNALKHRPLDRHPYSGDWNKNGKQRVEIVGGTLNMAVNLGETEISMTAGGARTESFSVADTDQTPNVFFEIDTSNRITQASVDLVANGEFEAYALSWDLGAYFLWEDLESTSFQDLAILDSLRESTQDTFSYGLFGGFSFDFLDDFTLSAGARFNRERKQFSIDNTIVSSNIPVPAFAEDEQTWMEPTGNIQLSYRFSESVSAYFKFNHGFKPGHFNSNGTQTRPTGVLVRPIAKPEFVDSFEVGFQAAFWEDRLRMNGALFNYDYQDYQVFLFKDVPGTGAPSLEVVNANDARVTGAELEAVFRPIEGIAPEPIEGLELTVRFGWLDSEFLDFQDSSIAEAGAFQFSIITDNTGNPLLNSPEFTVSGGIKWALGIGRFGEIEPRWDFSWTDDSFFDPTAGRGPRRPTNELLPEFTLGQRAYILHNVRLTFRPSESPFTVSGWCRNVADERFRTYAFDVSSFRGVIINFVGDPRTCGADLSFRW